MKKKKKPYVCRLFKLFCVFIIQIFLKENCSSLQEILREKKQSLENRMDLNVGG
jgi:hypothetical protein